MRQATPHSRIIQIRHAAPQELFLGQCACVIKSAQKENNENQEIETMKYGGKGQDSGK